MSRYRINIDNTPPSKAKIDAYKDFDALHKRYKVQSRYDFWRRLYRNPKYFAVLAALVAVGVLVYQSSLEQAPKIAAYIAPPIPPKNIPPVILESSLEGADTLSYESGTNIHVPAAAFVDEENQPVTGKVEIRYREFRDASEIFIAGIPMEYDSAGKVHSLESAAMLEVLAYSDNKPVFLKEGKTLEVEYYSPYKGTNFNVYHLDTLKKNWQFEGKDLLRETQEQRETPEKPELEYILDIGADTFLTRNVDIPAQKPGKVFQIQVINSKDYRLLAQKESIVWEYVEMAGFSDPWKAGRLPNAKARAKASPYRVAGVFTLEMNGGIKFVARPLLKATSFRTAQVEYSQKLAEYEQALATWKAQRRSAKKRATEREAARKAYEERLAEWEKSVAEFDSSKQEGVYRRFIIKHLGINQLGRIVHFPLMKVQVGFRTAENEGFGEKLYQNGRKISMIHPNLNTVFACKAHPAEKGQYLVPVDPNIENLLLVSDEQEHLYLLNFRKIPEDLSLIFEESPSSFKDHASLKAYLGERIVEIHTD